MLKTRREFIGSSAAVAAGFAGLRLASRPAGAAAAPAKIDLSAAAEGYGPLQPDPNKLLDLPAGFQYKIISRAGDDMDDGLLVPGRPDGMATFAGPDGQTIVMRNHELSPHVPGPFGEDADRLKLVDQQKLYDLGTGQMPSAGGVTTLVYDTRRQQVVRQFLSLGGTLRNCAGGPTPWGSWITCEEAVDTPTFAIDTPFVSAQDHGYAFDVPATPEPMLHEAKPLKAMGRFRREAVAIDPRSGIVYQTEDVDDGAFYRFVPDKPGDLAAGGKLQALAFTKQPSRDTRNWQTITGPNQTKSTEQRGPLTMGQSFAVRWIDMHDVESPGNDLRLQAYNAGGARFARGEGIWWTQGAAYFACTTGGHARCGQIWRYTPAKDNHDANDGGTLELFIEPNDSKLVKNADNLTVSHWGDMIVCEDRDDPEVRLVGVTPKGTLYTLANSHALSEFAGVCFSPDGSTLFVNIQVHGLTLAVTGPWRGV